jgi:hypothetical protein
MAYEAEGIEAAVMDIFKSISMDEMKLTPAR